MVIFKFENIKATPCLINEVKLLCANICFNTDQDPCPAGHSRTIDYTKAFF